jgi:hypothetical protein
MARDWHELFKAWSKPPSDTEEAKATRAAGMINDAVRQTGILNRRDFKVYATGSYRNNTNVKGGSDVDVALVLQSAFFYTLPSGVTASMVGLGPQPLSLLNEFRSEVHKALVQKFGSDVKPRPKTFNMVGNSGRLPADATAFLLHRRYTGKRDVAGSWLYLEGVETRSADDSSKRVINWHQEHYDNGVARNKETKKRFKRIARILKRLSDDMATNGNAATKGAAAPIASFLIESLVFNAPDKCFNREASGYYSDMQEVIAHCWRETKDDAKARQLLEVSKRKYLFGADQKWTRAQAHEFLLLAWRYVGFKS